MPHERAEISCIQVKVISSESTLAREHGNPLVEWSARRYFAVFWILVVCRARLIRQGSPPLDDARKADNQTRSECQASP